MRKRPATSYVIIGTAHLGLSLPILKTIGHFARYFNARVIHIGPLCTIYEKKMYDYRMMRVRTWEKLEDRNSQIEDLYRRYKKEAHDLISIQRKRTSLLREVFGDVAYVVNAEEMIPEDSINILGDDHELCKHLTLSSVPANGDKITGNPLTNKCVLAMREYATSVIMAHPIPATLMYKKEGVNCAFMFSTTGSLTFPEKCLRVTDIHKQILKPAFLFIGVDSEAQGFHSIRVRVKSHRDEKMHRHMPHIAYDGLIFTSISKDPTEAPEADKATYITDIHAPNHAEHVLECFYELNSLHKPGIVIDGGDTADFASVSRHTKHYPGARENLRLIDELNIMREVLDSIKASSSTIKKVIVLDSNHPEWLTQFVAENPCLKGLLDWESLARTYFKDYELVIRKGDTRAFWFGDLAVRHGDQEGSLMEAHLSYRNYICGHHHSFSEIGDAVRCGCASLLDPRYLQGNNTSWQHYITTFTMYRGLTCKHPRIVLTNKAGTKSTFMFRGTIYEISNSGSDEENISHGKRSGKEARKW